MTRYDTLAEALVAALGECDPGAPTLDRAVQGQPEYGLPDHMNIDWDAEGGRYRAEVELTRGDFSDAGMVHWTGDRADIVAAFADPAAFADDTAPMLIGQAEDLAAAEQEATT